MTKSLSLFVILILVFSCQQKDLPSDAYGNFEANPVNVSSDVSGRLIFFNIEEGQQLKSGSIIGTIDTVPLYLNLQEIEVQKTTVRSKITYIIAQTGTLEQQKKNLAVEQKRLENLLMANAATQKQMDDMAGKMKVLDSQIRAMKAQQRSVRTEIKVLQQKETLVRDQLDRCYIKNPIRGTVLEKYAENFEMAVAGRPLYKIADLSYLKLRVYVAAPLLSGIRLGDPVDIKVDQPDGNLKSMKGKVTWIASEAEFTPKIIQTREERAKLVYAVKIMVPNDGTLKIGMPGEANFSNAHDGTE